MSDKVRIYQLTKELGIGRGAWVCADNPNCHTRKGLGRLFRNQSEVMANALAARYTDSTHNGGTNV